MMKIAFICNQNQARSQVLSSVFASLLTSCEFNSFGLIAREATPLPIVIKSVFEDWGLDPNGRFAKNLELHWNQIQGMDIVVAITSFIAQEVESRGFHGLIIDLEQEASRLGAELMDPQLMPRRQCAYELAKYLQVAVSTFKRIGLISKGPHVLALVPENEAAINKTVAAATAIRKGDSSVILADLIAPVSSTALNSNTHFSRFRVDELTSAVDLLEAAEGPRIYLPKSAAMHPARVYLSRYWHQFTLGLTTESVIIATPPQKNATGKLPESYLCALYADEIQVVQS